MLVGSLVMNQRPSGPEGAIEEVLGIITDVKSEGEGPGGLTLISTVRRYEVRWFDGTVSEHINGWWLALVSPPGRC